MSGGDVVSDDRYRSYTFVESVRRFFWLPREVPQAPAPALPLARVGIFNVAAGAGIAALGWGDQVVLIMLGSMFAMVDDVIKGVRYRWPGFVVGLAAAWGADRLVRAVNSAPADPDWADYPALATGSLAALVAFAAITRLPGRQGAALR
jgi:peptidoglycan/LPS O-acetylase OafA/YrhL